MADQNVPHSPEEYPSDVRRELEQTDVTHEGEAREPGEEEAPMSSHLGATEEEPTPVTPPMTGPSRVTEGVIEDEIDPREELTGG